MKKTLFTLFFIAISVLAQSQIKAVTEDGREVILFKDGTWKYLQDSSSHSTVGDSLPTNETKFIKTNGSTFLVKSKTFNVGIYINPTKWIFAAHKENEKIPEYRFSLKSGDAYAMMITETIEIDLDNLRQIAFSNAQKVSLDIKETNAEYRIVNNKKVLCLKMQGTTKGVKFAYLGYYYSSPNGTVQLVTYSSQKDFESNQKEMENFLNGFVELDK